MQTLKMSRQQVKSTPRKVFSIDTTDKATRRIIAPYVKVVRKFGVDKTKESEKFSFYLKNKPSVLLQDFSKYLSDSMDLCSVLLESAEVLKMVTKANDVTLYMVDSASEEIYQVPKNEAEDSCQRVNFKIQTGTTLAAHVARTKEYVMLDDILCDHRFPLGLGYPDDMIKSALCVPIVTNEGDCYALLEMYRTVTEQPFTKEDLKISIVVSGWMGAAIHQNRLRLGLQQQQELNDYLLDLTKCYFADNVPLEKLITEIVKFAKATLGAERGSFFIIDPESEDMVAEVFDEGLDGTETTMHKKNIKVRLRQDRSIPGLVARTGVTVNIRDAYNDPRFFTPVEVKTGFITRSILCMPIVSVDNILGVVQVVNKINGVVFTASDETLFKTFSVYCALALHYARLFTKLHRMEKLNDSNEILLGFQIKPCIHDIEAFIKQPEVTIPTAFDDFRWYVSPDEYQYMPQLALHMVKNVVTFKDIDVPILMQFILTVRKCYRPQNPYHNWDHGFNVGHCMYNLLYRNLDLFSEVEIKSLLIACLCHDLDHGGYTNNYLQLTDDTLAQLYDESFLENHHFRVTMKIYGVFPFYKVSEEMFKKIRKEIKDIILASDLINHFKVRMKFVKVHNETEGFDWNNRHHRQICKDLMMTACDLSGVCKPFLVAKNLVDAIYREYYNQGDKEKAMGLTPLSLMDREKSAVIPEDQVQFLTVIVLPCCEMLKELLPNSDELYKEALLLRKTWQEIIDLKGQKSWRHNDSVVNQID